MTEYKPAGSVDQPEAKRAKVEPVKTTVKRSTTFKPLQDALSVDWSSGPYSKKLKKAESSYFLLKSMSHSKSLTFYKVYHNS